MIRVRLGRGGLADQFLDATSVVFGLALLHDLTHLLRGRAVGREDCLLKQIVKHITGVVSNYGCWEIHSQLLPKYI